MIKEESRSITISAIRIRQPIGDIYVGSIPAKTLVDITDFDIRALVEERGIDSYLGIQRELDRKRVAEIAQYVQGPDATFPTAVVLAVPEKCVTIVSPCTDDERFVRMTLSNYPLLEEEDSDDPVLYKNIARVIDGQHRIKGLEGYSGGDFDVNVSIFIDADVADQAAIFSTVNLAQTKVSKSLVYDLFELSNSRSPEKTCHSVVVALESTKSSPFYRKIKRLGKATAGRYTETLSQATVVSGVLQFICKDKKQVIQDRQIGRRGGKFPPAASSDMDKLVLRPFFVEGRDLDLTNLLWNYFDAVGTKWPNAWEKNATGYMLNRTNGFNGLMAYFRHCYRYLATPGSVVDAEEFHRIIDRSSLKDEDFSPETFPPGSSGASRLAKTLLEQTGVLASD
jgi:DGQHR domain-containing protein